MGSSNSTQPLPKNAKTVIVVGGGYAGIRIAKDLDSKCFTILIDQKNYFYHNVAALRAAADPDFLENLGMSYAQMLTNGFFIQGLVTNVNPSANTIQVNGTTVSYDALVICTGAKYNFPFKTEEFPQLQMMKERYTEYHAALRQARSVTIVGGGATGCELAGEIAYYYPEKRCQIIQRPNFLVHPRMSDFVENALMNVGVHVSMGKTYDESTANEFVKQDLIVFATGLKPCTEFVADVLPLNEKKRIAIDGFGKVENFDNIFACGDCAGNEVMMAYWADIQGELIAKNVVHAFEGKNLDAYPSTFDMQLLTIGPKGGVMMLPCCLMPCCGDYVVSSFKGTSLFVEKYRDGLNTQQGDTFEQNFEEEDFDKLSSGLQITVQQAQQLVGRF